MKYTFEIREKNVTEGGPCFLITTVAVVCWLPRCCALWSKHCLALRVSTAPDSCVDAFAPSVLLRS